MVTTKKQDCEILMNAVLPLAGKMLGNMESLTRMAAT